MNQLARDELFTLEAYAQTRDEFRTRVLTEKRNRTVMLGEHLRLLFENRLTIQFQIQEMLRIEKIFDAAGIEEELAAYNPLIPDGDNWKATMLLQYPDVTERRARLTELVNIENQIWVRVGDSDKVYAIADEDLERADEHKTSAVHFLRFQLSAALVTNAKNGQAISFGVDHARYTFAAEPVSEEICASLTADLR